MRQLLGYGVRRLAVPAILGLAIATWANTGAAEPAPAVRHLLLGVWWLSLLAGAIGVCRLVADLGENAAMAPHGRRLAGGLWSIVAAMTIGATAVLVAVGHARRPVATGALGVVLLLLAGFAVLTLRDLDDLG